MSQKTLDQVVSLLDKVYDRCLTDFGSSIKLNVKLSLHSDSKEPLLEHCKQAYKALKLFLLPLHFLGDLNERSLVKLS